MKYDGVPPYETTQQYVKMVLTEYQRERARLGDKK
jgi:soluble lytic murein transglycosylase-like protein